MEFSKAIQDALKKVPLPYYWGDKPAEEIILYVKFYDPDRSWEWYLAQYDPENHRAVALVKGLATEFGSMWFNPETLPKNIIQEYDFEPTTLAEVWKVLSSQADSNNYDVRQKESTYDVFISYATEDEKLASQIAGGLTVNDIRVWFAPLTLEVGDQLLKSLDDGMRQSFAGLILLSPNYIAKKWTRYEFDSLMRGYIKHDKMLLPIWHNISEEEVETFSGGLAGLIALNSSDGVKHITDNLLRKLSQKAPTIATIPPYENPIWRFLQGRGEFLHINELAFNIWEALIHIHKSKFPIFVAGQLLQYQDLVNAVAQEFMSDPGFLMQHNTAEDVKKLVDICIEAGYEEEIITRYLSS